MARKVNLQNINSPAKRIPLTQNFEYLADEIDKVELKSVKTNDYDIHIEDYNSLETDYINHKIDYENYKDSSTIKISKVEIEFDEHLSKPMPHEIKNLQTGKTYRYGYQVSAEGIPQLISEEVI